MPYTHKKVGNKTCVYKKSTGKRVGCTSGPIKKYLAALHMHDRKTTIRDASMNCKSDDCPNATRMRGSRELTVPAGSAHVSVGKLKKFIKEIVLKEKLKRTIRGIINEVLTEERESPVVRNIKSIENFDELLKKPENVGQKFTENELDGIARLEITPYKTTSTEIRFGVMEDMDGNNKELVIRKNNGKYVGFFSVRKPVDVTPDDLNNSNSDDTNVDSDEPQVDEVFIIVSRPLTNTIKDVSLLVNFTTHLTNEYQIT